MGAPGDPGGRPIVALDVGGREPALRLPDRLGDRVSSTKGGGGRQEPEEGPPREAVPDRRKGSDPRRDRA